MTRTDIPDEVVVALRAAAGGAPPYDGDLATVRRRGRARRRRRTAAAAGFAAVAVAVAVAVPSAVGGRPAGPVGPPPQADPPPVAPAEPPEPAQRLLLDGAGWVLTPTTDGTEAQGAETGETARAAYERLRDVPGAVGVLGGLAELRPDGEVVDIELDPPGIDSVREVVAMPDGRLAAIGIVDRMPGVAREDGPCVEGVDFPLLVIEADGSVGISREVRVMCEAFQLLAAEADTVYLVRGESRLVAHDLATGQERTVLESHYLGELGARGSVAAGRLVTVTDDLDDPACASDQLVMRVEEFDGGPTSAYPLAAIGCVGSPGPVRVSPDGRFAAVAFFGELDTFSSELRVAIVDLSTGEVVADQPFVAEDGEYGVGEVRQYTIANASGAVAGIAWDDERTLRVAWYQVPEEGVHWIADVVQATRFTMPDA